MVLSVPYLTWIFFSGNTYSISECCNIRVSTVISFLTESPTNTTGGLQSGWSLSKVEVSNYRLKLRSLFTALMSDLQKSQKPETLSIPLLSVNQMRSDRGG